MELILVRHAAAAPPSADVEDEARPLTDRGLRQVCEHCGIDWPAALQRVAAADIAYAEENRQALFDAGCWGVPVFRVGDFVTWGRDRMWMLGF